MRFLRAILGCVILALQLGSSLGNSRNKNKLFLATHSNFLRSTYHYGGITAIGSHEVLCRDNATICTDPVKNPKGGVCCFNSVCKNVKSDVNNCGACNKACTYGLSCCRGSCVNLMTDSHNCGECNTRCHHKVTCEFGLCGYAGESSSDDDSQAAASLQKARFPKQW